MNLIEQCIKANANELKQILLSELREREPHQNYTGPILAEKKERQAMHVSYNGFTGELVKLEKKSNAHIDLCSVPAIDTPAKYDLSIYNHEKKVTHSFTGVKLADVKFLGGVVSFGE